MLTVQDNGGLVGNDTVVINVGQAPNVLPTAVAAATSPTSGLAPLTVNFSSAGSVDSDGTLSSYSWNFGDGGTSTELNPSWTYTVPGNYNAHLTVTDNRGGSKTSVSIPISVAANPGLKVDISQLSLVANNAKSGATGSATLYVRDATSAVAGASVTVQWSGVVAGSSTGTTDATGKVIFTSPKTKKGGSVTVTVGGVTPPAGRAYDPTLFAPTSAPTATVGLN